MSYELKDKSGQNGLATTVPSAQEGESYYATGSSAVPEKRSIWQRSIDSFKPPVQHYVPQNSGDVENQKAMPVSRTRLQW